MAAMLSAFARLVRERPPGSASVLLACTVDEEFTHTGSSRLAETKHGAELAIVAEPTSLNLVHCHKGASEVEDPDQRASPATARPRTWASTPSTGWAGSSTFSRNTPACWPLPGRPTRSSARPACRSVGSRGDRASTWFPTGARSKSIAA